MTTKPSAFCAHEAFGQPGFDPLAFLLATGAKAIALEIEIAGGPIEYIIQEADHAESLKAEQAKRDAQAAKAAYRKANPCPRCNGRGRLEAYRHIADGVCFKCGGDGLAYGA